MTGHRTGRALRALTVLCAGAVLTGCFAPQPPRFGDGVSVPAEQRRIPLTVPPGPDGSWSLLEAREGLIGEGRKLARIPQEAEEGVHGPVKGWTATLPAEFAITSRLPGRPHSAVGLLQGIVLIGGRTGRTDPTAVALAEPSSGVLLWRHPLPPDSRVLLLPGTTGPTIGAATCSAAGCRFTAWDMYRGTRQWSSSIPGAYRVRTPCGADALGGRDAAPGLCGPLVIGKDRVGTLDEETHRPVWIPGLRPPAGTVDRVAQANYRTFLVTAPAKGSCRATVLAAAPPGDEHKGWRYDFVWDQPQAARDPHTGCRWNPGLPLKTAFDLVLPVRGGALVVDPYFGPEHQPRRLAEGAYAVAADGRGSPDLIRAPGRPDRPLDPALADRRRTEALGAGARQVSGDLFQYGRKLLLVGYDGTVRWRGTSDCIPFSAVTPGEVTYCDGRNLVEIKAVKKD
ncbi:hypothetical protein LRD69_30165 [Streptomyces sp. JH14]|uniref:hypothetical protein n=1 Tax=Streptomyces sp. JH14 TaxID=2793630 RepID=UPI0023F8DE55|nr:hypothetical protein [Streptomyces sp. JH14]MDF6046317.1 hypothetical protein [Streptomyces sp. JH14]